MIPRSSKHLVSLMKPLLAPVEEQEKQNESRMRAMNNAVHPAATDAEFTMKRLMIVGISVGALTATAIVWAPPLANVGAAETAGMPSLQELHALAGVSKLPHDHFEDRSLVFPANAQ
jgi:predicted esterase